MRELMRHGFHKVAMLPPSLLVTLLFRPVSHPQTAPKTASACCTRLKSTAPPRGKPLPLTIKSFCTGKSEKSAYHICYNMSVHSPSHSPRASSPSASSPSIRPPQPVIGLTVSTLTLSSATLLMLFMTELAKPFAHGSFNLPWKTKDGINGTIPLVRHLLLSQGQRISQSYPLFTISLSFLGHRFLYSLVLQSPPSS